MYPVTQVISKQLLAVYDKPMVHYLLTTLMMAGVRDILVISTPHDTPRFSELLGDEGRWGINIQFAVQASPNGSAQAFVIDRSFVGEDPAALILGDNIFYGHELARQVQRANARLTGATVVADQIGAPTNSLDIARFVADCALPSLATAARPANGVYHLTATGHTSWHGFATAIREEAARIPSIATGLRVRQVLRSRLSTIRPRPFVRGFASCCRKDGCRLWSQLAAVA